MLSCATLYLFRRCWDDRTFVFQPLCFIRKKNVVSFCYPSTKNISSQHQYLILGTYFIKKFIWSSEFYWNIKSNFLVISLHTWLHSARCLIWLFLPHAFNFLVGSYLRRHGGSESLPGPVFVWALKTGWKGQRFPEEPGSRLMVCSYFLGLIDGDQSLFPRTCQSCSTTCSTVSPRLKLQQHHL